MNALDFAPDGRLFVAGQDGGIRIIDPSDPSKAPVFFNQQHTLFANGGAIGELAFAPDGRLVTTHLGDVLKVWDMRIPDVEPVVLSGQGGGVKAWTFAPDGRLATASSDGTIRLWDLAARSGPILFSRHEGGINDLAFAPDGRLVSAGAGLRVWDVRVPSASPQIIRPQAQNPLASLAVSTDGRLILIGNFFASVADLRAPLEPPSRLSSSDMTLVDRLVGRKWSIQGLFASAVSVTDLRGASPSIVQLAGCEMSLNNVHTRGSRR